MKDIIQKQAEELFTQIKSIREHIHANPELSFEEFETSKYIQEQLKSFGITNFEVKATTGVVGVIEGGKPGKTLALRADIDALPIIEQNKTPYVSKKEGVMHACGHDVHSSCLLGALAIIEKNKAHLEGRVKFIFQPGEEKLPGGASLLIKEGVLDNPQVDSIVGQHVFPELETGKVGFRPGPYMASCDEVYVTVKGKGGHGAMPHQTVDSVYIAAQIIVTLQNVISRKIDPTVPCVLSFGKVEANGATNVIPSEVKIEGTFRILNEEWRAKAHDIIEKQAQEIAQALGGDVDVHIAKGYPFLHNDEATTIRKKSLAQEYLGAKNVIDLPIRMTGEDFAFYSQSVPACFYRLGVRNEEKGIVHGVHHPQFDIDSEALKTGMGLMAYLALNGES